MTTRTHNLGKPSAPSTLLGRREPGEVAVLIGGVVAGVTLSILCGTVVGSIPAAVIALIVFAGGAGFAVFVPLPGGTVYQRLPRDLRYATARRKKTLVYHSGARQAGYVPVPDGDETKFLAVDVPPPSEVGSLRWMQTTFRGDPLAVISHRLDGALTAAVEVEGPGLGMFDVDDLLAVHSRFSTIRRDVANGDGFVTHLAQLTRTLPSDSGTHAAYIASRADPDCPPIIADAYTEQMRSTEAHTDQHRSYVVVRLDPTVARGKAVRLAGGGDAGQCALVGREVDGIASRLEDAGFKVVGPVSAVAMVGLIRNTYNPDCMLDDIAGLLPRDAWPHHLNRLTDHVEADGWHHATAAVRLPTIPVQAGFMLPMLVQAPGVIRSLVVVDRLIPTDVAMDRALESMTHTRAAENQEAKAGQVEDPRNSLSADSTQQLAFDLANGAAACCSTVYLLLSARSEDALARAVSRYRSTVVRSWCRPEWLTKEHGAGLVNLLPFGRGAGK